MRVLPRVSPRNRTSGGRPRPRPCGIFCHDLAINRRGLLPAGRLPGVRSRVGDSAPMPAASEPRIHAVDALQRALRVAPAMTSEGARWKQVTVCLWRSPWIRAYDLAATDEVIVALHTGGSKSVRAKVGAGWAAGGSNTGHVHVIPAGFATGYRPEGELEFVSVHIGAERVRTLANADGGDETHVAFRFAFHDAFIGSCVQALREEMQAPREHGSLYVDSVTD